MPKSKSDVHITPDRVWDLIKEKWNHDQEDFFDPCPEFDTWDGLNIEWDQLNYVNPPYTLLKEFVEKALVENNNGKETVLLLPTKTDQQWFHDLLSANAELVWIRRRLKFKNNKWSATQPHFLARLK
tara:strand:+ start:62 stop:442 length:381 start_codon:yes stop_codon:yes gene_type:complete